ncbi:hypothetical protein ACQ4PT_019224 [Festuca glaucescens]
MAKPPKIPKPSASPLRSSSTAGAPPPTQGAKIPKPSSSPLRSSSTGAQQPTQDKYIVPIMSVAGNSSNLCSSRVGERDKNSTAKLLLSAAGEMLVNPDNAGLSLTDLKLQHLRSSVKAFLDEYIASEDLDLGSQKEHVELDGFPYVDWTDLRGIALYSLHVFFKTAVETISQEGYTEDAVIHAIRDSALCYQFDGPITKIADSARAMLKSGRQVDSPLSENLDMHLHMLGLYVLSCASSLLKKYFPFFAWSDALWCIMLCDMDISIAHAFSVDMSSYGNEQSDWLVVNNQNINDPSGSYSCSPSESPGRAALPQSEQLEQWRAALSQSPERMWSKVLADYIAIHKSAGRDHVSSSGQDHVSSAGQDHVSSSGQLEKPSSLARTVVTHNKKAAKGTSSKRSLKESRSVMAFLESANSTLAGTSKAAKSLKSSTSFTTMHLSNLSLLKKIDAPTVVSSQPTSSPVNHSSSSSSTGKTVTKRQAQPGDLVYFSLPPVNHSSSSSSTGKTASKQQTEPGGLIHFSLPNTPADGFDFEFSHDGMRTSWVPKDRKEEIALDLIRRLGELKLEVKIWTDWASERLLQSLKRLAIEQPSLALLRKEKETSECGVLTEKLEETKKSLCDISVELDRVDSLELKLTDEVELSTQKILLQEKLAAERSNLCRLLQNLEQAEGYKYVLEKKLEGGKKMMDEAMKQVDIARNEVERIKLSARRKSNNVLVNAENEKKRLQASAKELQKHIKGLEFDLARGRPQRLAVLMGPPVLRPDSVEQERECQMCLDEDVSVVFLPCGHQIFCISCNQLHQDKGVPDCPFCRSPIQRRICAQFSDS